MRKSISFKPSSLRQHNGGLRDRLLRALLIIVTAATLFAFLVSSCVICHCVGAFEVASSVGNEQMELVLDSAIGRSLGDSQLRVYHAVHQSSVFSKPCHAVVDYKVMVQRSRHSALQSLVFNLEGEHGSALAVAVAFVAEPKAQWQAGWR